MITTYFFFCNSNFKVEIASVSSPLNRCLLSILRKTLRGADRIDFLDFRTWGDFSGSACLRLGDFSLVFLDFDTVEGLLRIWQGPVPGGLNQLVEKGRRNGGIHLLHPTVTLVLARTWSSHQAAPGCAAVRRIGCQRSITAHDKVGFALH